MKLTEVQKKRLAALLAKAASTPNDITAGEQSEINDLKAKAEKEATDEGKAFDEAAFIKAFGEQAKEVTEDDLNAAVEKAVTKAFEGKGLKTADIVAELKKSLGDGGSVKIEDIESAVQKHVDSAKIDKDALLAEIKKAMPGAGLSKADLDAAFTEFAAKQHGPSVHQFPTFGGSLPVEHRSGNLSVAQKQLLNLTLMQAPEESLAKSGTKRPTSMNDGIRESDLKHAVNVGQRGIKSLRESIIYGGKAITTSGSGSGAELIPTDLSSELQMRMYLDSQLAAALISTEIDMPSDPFKLPLKTTRTEFFTGSEAPGSDPTASNPAFANITLETAKLIGIAEYSYEADEDSIIAILPMLQEDMAAGAAYSFESAVLNGDTTGTHMDSDFHAVTNHHAKAFKGIRKLAFAGSSTLDIATGGVSAANIAAMRKQMKRWGVRSRDLMLVVGPNAYNDIVSLDETLTFDKVGSAEAARILTGSAASIYGIPIVVSDAARENLNASGVYDGTTTTKGAIYLVHKPSWVVGVRRGFTVEVDVDKRRQINAVIASFRRDFKPKETVSANMPLVVAGYNYNS